MKQYLSWSLRNVLQRGSCSAGCDYWLNPVQTGVETCVSVHNKKASAVFGSKATKGFDFKNLLFKSVNDAIAILDADANEYAKTLKPPTFDFL